MKHEEDQQNKKEAAISYYSKDQIECPVCGAKFKREEMYSGGGRVIAGNLTEELRRLYEPSAKYGEVYLQYDRLSTVPLHGLYTRFSRYRKTDCRKTA